MFCMSNNTLIPITIDNLTSYLVKEDLSYSVAIPFSFNKPIFEEFVGMDVYTSYANYNKNSINII